LSAKQNATKKSYTYVVRASPPPELRMWLCTGNLE